MGMCEVCGVHVADIHRRIPGLYFPCWYCVGCYKANAQPPHLLAAEVWLLGGIPKMDAFTSQLVYSTLRHLGISIEEFSLIVDNYRTSYALYCQSSEEERLDFTEPYPCSLPLA